jgi:hypothetical protein
MQIRIQDPKSFNAWMRDPEWKNSDPGLTSQICNTGNRKGKPAA